MPAINPFPSPARAFQARPWATAAAIAVTLLVAACSDKPSAEDKLVREISDTIQADSTLDDDQADCLAREVVDHVGTEDLQAAGFDGDDADFADLTAEAQQDIFDAAENALDTCDVSPADLGE